MKSAPVRQTAWLSKTFPVATDRGIRESNCHSGDEICKLIIVMEWDKSRLDVISKGEPKIGPPSSYALHPLPSAHRLLRKPAGSIKNIAISQIPLLT